MKITVVGAGYVGLSLGTLLSVKHHVTILDIIKEKIEQINNRICPIKDNYIEDYFANKDLDLVATINEAEAYNDAEYVIIATPTDYDRKLNALNLNSVESVVKNCLQFNRNCTFIIKSTVPIGYTRSLGEKYNFERIMFSPEFLRETYALYDNLYPSRIVIGTDLQNKQMISLAQTFANILSDCAIKENIPILIIDKTEAEAVKLFSNTYLAMRVAFFNELDTFADTNHLNTKNIITAMSKDPRIGDGYNNPSFGYGGYCLPKDTKQLRSNFKHIPENLITAICKSNNTRKDYIIHDILNKQYDTIGIYRLVMKSGSDNFKSSAILDIIATLIKNGKKIIIYEPILNAEQPFMGCEVINSFDLFKESCDVILANRIDSNLDSIIDKVYSRDSFNRD